MKNWSFTYFLYPKIKDPDFIRSFLQLLDIKERFELLTIDNRLMLLHLSCQYPQTLKTILEHITEDDLFRIVKIPGVVTCGQSSFFEFVFIYGDAHKKFLMVLNSISESRRLEFFKSNAKNIIPLISDRINLIHDILELLPDSDKMGMMNLMNSKPEWRIINEKNFQVYALKILALLPEAQVLDFFHIPINKNHFEAEGEIQDIIINPKMSSINLGLNISFGIELLDLRSQLKAKNNNFFFFNNKSKKLLKNIDKSTSVEEIKSHLQKFIVDHPASNTSKIVKQFQFIRNNVQANDSTVIKIPVC